MSENQEKNPNEDVFHDAAMDASLNKALSVIDAETPSEQKEKKKDNDLLLAIKSKIEKGETKWDIMKNMIEGGFTERFMKIMATMPDKDFAAYYIKLLEHFKPKLTRKEGGPGGEVDNVINIQTMIINKDTGEQEIIDITKLQNNEQDI